MKAYLFYTVEDFVEDLSFIRWVSGSEENSFFDDFYEKYPHKREEMDEAIEIIRFFGKNRSKLDDKEVYELWKRIKTQKRSSKRKLNGKILKWAAMLLVLIGIGSIIYFHYMDQWNGADYLSENVAMTDTSRPRLVLSEKRVIRIPSDTVQIRYDAAGEKIVVNSGRTLNFSCNNKTMHKLVIPYGKRGRIILGDGTHIWVNSGSRLVYPSSFGNKKRKVFLMGEAYFEVANNTGKPFRVETSELDVDVLGTSFNVSSYQEDKSIETVVVEGKVQIRKKGLLPFGEKIKLNPSQRVVYEKDNDAIKKDQVDIRHHTSWKEGYLYVNGESLETITRHLGRIYNMNMVLEKSLKSLKFSGKLDLKEDLEAELNIIATAHPIEYTIKNNKVIINPEP